MRAVRNVVLAIVVFAVASWLAPWWIVPVVAIALALAFPRAFSPGVLALAAGLSWAAILGLLAVQAPVNRLARELGGLVRMPAAVPVLVTVAWAAVLAWSAAAAVWSSGRGRGAAHTGHLNQTWLS